MRADRPSTTVEQIANAVLYEGYLLYPYRPSSVKNRQRWTFGGIYPRAYSEAQAGSDAWSVGFSCLVIDDVSATVDVCARFLHLLDRHAQDAAAPSWQEAAEREVCADDLSLELLAQEPMCVPFRFPDGREVDGEIVRERQAISGAVEISAEPVIVAGTQSLYRLTVSIVNLTPFDAPDLADPGSRDAALMHALVSAHAILRVRGGSFISQQDPPLELAIASGTCHNAGLWPVLAGEPGQRDTVLASPIILYDYPEIAPESPGDLFDGTEIDEILTLRILTLTEAEKAELRQSDERARALLDRTESLTADALIGLHGTMRQPRHLLSRAGESGAGGEGR